MIAALYVEPGGVYWDRPDVEPWGCRKCPDEPGAVELPERDARLYEGPWPVVAHPPCARWGRYWSGGPNPNQKQRRQLGDDGGCFAAALAAVRRRGGVLEHPEASKAWAHFGLIPPPHYGGWYPAGDWRGWTCCVEQGHYGHRARKKTWLLAYGVTTLPQLIWGPSKADPTLRIDEGFHSTDERRRKQHKTGPCSRMTPRERLRTPPAFAEVLLGIARSVQPTYEQRARQLLARVKAMQSVSF
jgi:hypothetical protein